MDGGGVVAVGRAEIDTRAPFKSVKEAVALFGEKVLAGELLHAGGRRIDTQNRVTAPRPAINHYQPAGAAAVNVAVVPPPPPRHIMVPATRELDAAKNELEKEREEKHKMAGCILSLQEELSNTMRELKKLKARDEEAQAKVIDLQEEDLKFMEMNNQKQQQRSQSTAASIGDVDMAAKHAAAAVAEFQKKRYVTFADPPTAAYDRAPSPPRPLPDVVMELHPQQQYAPSGRPQYREVRFQRQVSVGHQTVKKVMAAAAEEEGTKKKKKPLIPLVSALFMRKKKSSSGHHDDGSSAVKPRPSF